MATPQIDVLGRTRLVEHDHAIDLSPRQRAVVAGLALRFPRAVPFDDLIAMVWGAAAPKTARAALQNAVAAIRTKLDDPGLIETDGASYRLADGADIDVNTRVSVVAAAVATPAASTDGDELRRELDAWEPHALADLSDDDDVVAARARLASLRDAGVDQVGAALLASGRTAEALGYLEAALIASPTQAVRAALLAVALQRSGAAADALTLLELTERRSVEEAGIGLPAGIASLRARILDNDPSLHAHAILDDIRRDIGLSASAGPVVGRDEELIEVLEYVARRRSVVVVGPGGLGKTTLLDAVCGRLASLVARTTCTENPESPYEPIVAVLDEIAAQPAGAAALRAAVPGADPGALAWLAPGLMVFDPDSEPPPRRELRRARADAAVCDLLSALGRRVQLTIVIDDIHLAPDTTLGILATVASRSDATVVAAGRPGERPFPDSFRSIALRPLDAAAVTALVGRLMEAEGDDFDDVGAELARRTGGNAFFVVATVRHLLDRGALRRTDGVWALSGDAGVPPTVEVAVAQRLDVLSLAARRVVDHVAVAADPVDRALIETVLGPAAGRGIEEAVQERVLVEQGPLLRTVHDLLGEATRLMLSDARAIEIHDRLAAAYAAGPDPDLGRVARHRFAARRLDPGAAVEALERAAEGAREAVAPEFAADHLAKARQIVDAPGSRHGIRLAIEEGSARREAGDPLHVDLLREAAFTAHREGHADLTADALIELGDVGRLTGPGGADADVTELVTQLIDSLDDPHREARVRATASVWFAMGPHWERAHELWAEALAVAESSGDPHLVCEVLRLLDRGTDGPHHGKWRVELSRRCIELGEDLDDPLAEYRGHLAGYGAMLQHGTGAELDAHVTAMERLEPTVHNGRGRRVLSYFRAGRAHLHGELAAAEGFLNAASGFPNVLSESWDLLASSSVLLAIRLEQGRGGELDPLAEAMSEAHPHMGVWLAAAARCALELGDHRRAAEMVRRLHDIDYETISQDQVWLLAMTSTGRVAADVGLLDIAEHVAERLEPYRGNGSWCGHGAYDPVDVGLCHIALAADRLDDAADHADAAIAVATRLDAPIYVGRGVVLAAEVAARHPGSRDRWDDIETRLRETHDLAVRSGWHALRDEAAATLATSAYTPG